MTPLGREPKQYLEIIIFFFLLFFKTPQYLPCVALCFFSDKFSIQL